MAQPLDRLGVCATLAAAVMAVSLTPEPSQAQLAAQDFRNAEKLAEGCGKQTVLSGVCGLRSPFSPAVRSAFLANARRRGASVEQLKNLNWTWQLAVDGALKFLRVARFNCTLMRSKTDEFRQMAQRCKRSP